MDSPECCLNIGASCSYSKGPMCRSVTTGSRRRGPCWTLHSGTTGTGIMGRKSGSTPLERARSVLLDFPGVEEAPCYGTPGFRVVGKFLARLREDGETLIVKCGFVERDLRMQQDPDTFFTTDHYRAHPSVLVNLRNVRIADCTTWSKPRGDCRRRGDSSGSWMNGWATHVWPNPGRPDADRHHDRFDLRRISFR